MMLLILLLIAANKLVLPIGQVLHLEAQAHTAIAVVPVVATTTIHATAVAVGRTDHSTVWAENVRGILNDQDGLGATNTAQGDEKVVLNGRVRFVRSAQRHHVTWRNLDRFAATVSRSGSTMRRRCVGSEIWGRWLFQRSV